MKEGTGKKILTVIVSVILWVVIILAAVFAFTTLATKDTNKVANIAGYTPLAVQTDSMAPTFKSGDLIIIKQVDKSTLQVGDIITFHTIINNEYVLNTHRIHEIRETGNLRLYVTKGDNNPIADTSTIGDGDIVGKYVGRIPVLGKVINFLSTSLGFLLVIVLPMLLFFAYQVYHLIMVSISLKKATAMEAAEAETNSKLSEAEEALREAQRIKAELEAQLAAVKKESSADQKAGGDKQ